MMDCLLSDWISVKDLGYFDLALYFDADSAPIIRCYLLEIWIVVIFSQDLLWKLGTGYFYFGFKTYSGSELPKYREFGWTLGMGTSLKSS